MQALAAVVAALFGGLMSFMVAMVGKKLAIGAAAVAVFATLTAALAALLTTAINTALALLSTSMPTWAMWGFWYFLPSVAPSCAAALIAAEAAAAVYRWNVKNLELMTFAS